MKPTKMLVEAEEVGRFKNVKYMMKSDDFRLKDSKWGYKVLDSNPKYDHKQKTLISNGVIYQVFEDWSLKAI